MLSVFSAVLVISSVWGEGEKQFDSRLFSNVRSIVICLEREIDHQATVNLGLFLVYLKWPLEH